MRYLLFGAALVASLHGYQYGKWLMMHRMKEGAMVVYFWVVLSILLSLHSILTD